MATSLGKNNLQLVGKGGVMNGYIFPLQIATLGIGKDPNSCAVIYPAETPGIAELHCQLTNQNGKWFVKDFSGGKTWLNGNALQNGQIVPINVGDVLSLATHENNFVLTSSSSNDGGSTQYGGSGDNPPARKTFKDKFFAYEGRLNRKAFIIRALIIWVLSIIIQAIVGAVFDPQRSLEAFMGVYLVVSLPLTVSAIMMIIRRLHDTDHSGWWWFILIIPLANIYGLYLLYIKKGTEGLNRFGANPIVNGKGEDVV